MEPATGNPAEAAELPALNTQALAAGTAQLDLFGGFDHPVLIELRKLDLSRLTPLQAMQVLDMCIRAARGEI